MLHCVCGLRGEKEPKEHLKRFVVTFYNSSV